MKRWQWIAAVAAALVVALTVLSARSSRGADVPLYQVRADRFVRRVTAEGTLKAAKSTPVTAPPETNEPLKIAWIAGDGSPVRAGDVVVRFDPTDFEKALREGAINRSTAANKLLKQGTESATTRTNLQLDAEQAQRELEAAQSFQRKDADVFSRYQIAESDIDRLLAQQKKEHASKVKSVRGRLSRADRELLEIEMRRFQMRIEQAQKGLKSLEVRAPHDGLLVLTRNWRGEIPQVGMTVWRGFPIGEIPDVELMEAEVFVLEADAGGLSVGQKAEVTLESNPSRVYSGTVKRVEPVAKPRFRGVPVQYFGVTLELPKADAHLMKPGTRVRARLVLEDQKNALTVPRQAIFEEKGKKIVFRWDNGKLVATPVSIGSISLGRAVVTSGLKEGDRISLLNPNARRKDEKQRRSRGSGSPVESR